MASLKQQRMCAPVSMVRDTHFVVWLSHQPRLEWVDRTFFSTNFKVQTHEKSIADWDNSMCYNFIWM